MSRDYKPRPKGKYAGQRRQKFDGQSRIGLWRWMLITAIIIAFVVFLVYLRSAGSKTTPPSQGSEVTAVENTAAVKDEKKPEVKPGPKIPQFDFYTILPEKEVVVPEHEIKTRTREERVGKAKETHYILQAGSFKTFKEADGLRTKLATMGMESTVQKAKVGTVNWYRVKMGPYTQMPSINSIKSRLRQNGIDVIITETGD